MAAAADMPIPPIFVPLDATYGADELALPFGDLIGEGIVGAGSLDVAQRGAGPNKSVDVAAGAVWVAGDDDPAVQGSYRMRSASVVNLAISANASGQPRIDRIIARVYDSTFAGVANKWALEVLEGTPTAGATKENANGAAAIPNNAVELARIQLANGYASVTDADILDTRSSALVGAGKAASNTPDGLRTLVARAEWTTVKTTTGLTFATGVTLVSLPSITFDGATVAVLRSYTPSCQTPSYAAVAFESLSDGGTTLGHAMQSGNNTLLYVPRSIERRFTPSAGAHTFSLVGWGNNVAGTYTWTAGAGGNDYVPGFLELYVEV